MKRWFWKRWAWTGVFGITAAVGLALGAGKDASPAPPKVGDVITLKFQNGPERHVKVLKTERRIDGSYQSEVKDMKSGEVFTLIDKSHEPPAAAKAAPSAAKAASTAPARPSFMPKAIDSKITIPQPQSIESPITTPQLKGAPLKAAPPRTPGADFSSTAKNQFTDPLLAEAGGTAPDAGRERKLFAPSKPSIVAAPAPMPESTPEPQKRPGLFKRLFGKDSTPPATAMPTPLPPNAAPVITPRPAVSAKPTPAFVPPSSVFESDTGAKPSTRSSTKPVPAFGPSDIALEPGTGATQPAPRVSAGTASIRTPRLFPSRTTTPSEPPRGSTSKPNVGSNLLPTPDRTPEPPRTAPSSLTPPVVTPPVAVVPVPVSPPTRPPTTAPAPLPIPTPPATIPAPVVQTPRTIAPITPAPSTPVLPAVPEPTTTAPVVPAVPTIPSLPTIPSVPGMSANHTPVMQAGFVSTAAAALAHDIQPHVTALRTAAAPSMRVMAAKALAGGRHASTDAVKSILFIACTTDPSPFVRACCIDELCKLGYFEPSFMVHLNKACGDPSEEVRTAAKDALKKMTPQR